LKAVQLPPLTCGRILRRYKRFLADVVLDDGTEVVAHCPNTGTMATCWAPGAPVELTRSDNPKRTLAWTLERVDMGRGWVGVHTGRVNGIIAEGIAAGAIPALAGYDELRREATVGGHAHPRARLDLLLSGGQSPTAWVEVKNATLLQGDAVRFPDAVTTRGLKHLEVLRRLVAEGQRGIILYAVNRPEGRCFGLAVDIDPDYARCLREVAAVGVEVIAVRLRHGPQSVEVGEAVPIMLDG